jgi:hypothetical protein
MIHVDIKPLGGIGCVGHRSHGDRRRASREAGWEYVHVAVDDHIRNFVTPLQARPDLRSVPVGECRLMVRHAGDDWHNYRWPCVTAAVWQHRRAFDASTALSRPERSDERGRSRA